MKKFLIKFIAFIILYLPLNSYAEEFLVKLSSLPSKSAIDVEISIILDQPSVIYNWKHANSMYPIINTGLFIECIENESKNNIRLISSEKVLPKTPHKLDVIKAKEYQETLKLVPEKNHTLKSGRYSLKLIYDPVDLRKYHGGESLTPMHLESNGIVFEIH